jgi:alpha-D-ribose 1-methylphosphonate 5-triphosphate synthase subunit PhnH
VRTISVEWATDQLSSLQQLLDARSDSWPMGFDIWLVDDFGQVVGIPRTSNITGVMVQHDEKVLED